MRLSQFRIPLLQFTFFLSFGAATPFLSLYFKHTLVTSDGSPAAYLIGLVFFAGAVAGVAAAPLFGYLSDRYHIQRGLLTLSALGLALGAAVLSIPGFFSGFSGAPGLPLAATATIVFIGSTLTGFFQRPTVPLIDLETLNHLRMTHGDTVRYGRFRMLGSAGWVISASLIGGLISITGRINDAVVASGIGYLILAAVAAARSRGELKPIRIPWAYLAKDRTYLLFLGYVFLNAVGNTSSITFGAYFMDDAHAGYFIIGLSFGLSALFEIPIMGASRELLRSWGNRWMIIAGTLAQAVRLGLFVLVANVDATWPFVVVNLLQGVGYGLTFVGMINFVDTVSHSEMRTTYLSIFNLMLGIGTALAGPFSSFIIATLGSTWLMAVDALVVLASLAYFAVVVRGHGPMRVDPVADASFSQ